MYMLWEIGENEKMSSFCLVAARIGAAFLPIVEFIS
jgi:hypothetical protein